MFAQQIFIQILWSMDSKAFQVDTRRVKKKKSITSLFSILKYDLFWFSLVCRVRLFVILYRWQIKVIWSNGGNTQTNLKYKYANKHVTAYLQRILLHISFHWSSSSSHLSHWWLSSPLAGCLYRFNIGHCMCLFCLQTILSITGSWFLSRPVYDTITVLELNRKPEKKLWRRDRLNWYNYYYFKHR